MYLKRVTMTGLFEDPEKADALSCEASSDDGSGCTVLDKEFNIEGSLVPSLIQAVVKELAGPAWRPKDGRNDAADDLADMMSFIRRTMKNELQRNIEQ